MNESDFSKWLNEQPREDLFAAFDARARRRGGKKSHAKIEPQPLKKTAIAPSKDTSSK